MSDLDGIYLAEPRLTAIEALVTAVAQRDGDVPWDDVHRLLGAFLGLRRDASVVAPNTSAVLAAMPRLRDEAVRVAVAHRLRDLAPSVDANRLGARS